MIPRGGLFASTRRRIVGPRTTGIYPNEPNGHAQISRNRFDTTPDFTADFNGITSHAVAYGPTWRRFQQTGLLVDGRASIYQSADASAPTSPSTTHRYLYRTGLLAGDQTGGEQWFNAGVAYRTWYERGTFKIGDASQAGFETQLVGVKFLGYWGVGVAVGSASSYSEFYNFEEGNQTTTAVLTSWPIVFAHQGAGGAAGGRMDQNVDTSLRMQINTWHTYEVLMSVNDIGVSNGQFKFWLDGVQTHNYSNRLFINAAYPYGFYGRKFDPVWGGVGGAARTRDDNIYFDDYYASGVLQ